MWSLGCLIWEVFNGSFTKNTSLKSPGKVMLLLFICCYFCVSVFLSHNKISNIVNGRILS